MAPAGEMSFTLQEAMQQNPQLKVDDVAHLRAWVDKQPHLPAVSDEQLAVFLHCCYYSLERAKRTIESHYTLKTHSPEFFSNTDPRSPALQEALKVLTVCVLPKTDSQGRTLVLARLAVTDPARFSLDGMVKVHNMCLALCTRESGLSPGFVLINDIAGVSVGHVGALSPSSVRKYVAYLQEGLPLRMDEIHVINATKLMDRIIMIAKPFLKMELLDKLKIHYGGFEEVHKHFPKALLPKDYGGDLESVAELNAALLKKLEDNSSWFLEQESLKADESKRIGGVLNTGNVFGVDGSFKKLDID